MIAPNETEEAEVSLVLRADYTPIFRSGFLLDLGGAIRSSDSRGDTSVALGIVKWFNPTKGYGFIRPDAGGPDVFVHISAVEKAGLTSLAEGVRISYELMTGRSGKTSAENLRLS